MNQCAVVQRLLRRELETFTKEIESFPDDESVWRTLPGVTNSAGNLALHVSGSLQHFLGAVLGGTGYSRNREREFGLRSGTRQSIVEELTAALRVVDDVCPRIPAARLEEAFPQTVGGVKLPTGLFLCHLTTHVSYHLGQAGYLRRLVTGNSASTGAVALPPLVQ